MWEMAALGRQGVVCVLERGHIANRHPLGDLVLKITWNAEDQELGDDEVENPVECVSAGSGHEAVFTFRVEFSDL